MPEIDLNRYQPFYVPLAIFAGCLVIAAAIYGSGGIRLGRIDGGEEPSESPAIAGEAETPPEPEAGPEEGSYDSATLDRFARCLAEKGAKLYAAEWCGHCKDQKELFGSSLQYLNSIECADESAGGWSEDCKKAEITGVPTWIFKDGLKAVGLQSLEALAEKTGCSLE